MRIYWIPEIKIGQLGMMARPKGNDWLEEEIRKLKLLGIDLVISLLERHEEVELEIRKESDFCKQYELEYFNYSIKDRGVPKEPKSFFELISIIDKALGENKKVVIHCRMGIGRTSLVAACLLIKRGFNPNEVFDLLSHHRTLSVPDTEEQIQWVKHFFSK